MGDSGEQFELPVVMAGFCRQAGTVAFQRGCIVQRVLAGTWQIVPSVPLPAESWVGTGMPVTGFSPGFIVEIGQTSINLLTLFTYAQGIGLVDVDVNFSIRRILPGG